MFCDSGPQSVFILKKNVWASEVNMSYMHHVLSLYFGSSDGFLISVQRLLHTEVQLIQATGSVM